MTKQEEYKISQWKLKIPRETNLANNHTDLNDPEIYY